MRLNLKISKSTASPQSAVHSKSGTAQQNNKNTTPRSAPLSSALFHCDLFDAPSTSATKSSTTVNILPSSSAPRDEHDRLLKLVTLQSYDGSFNLDNYLCNLLGIKLNDVKDFLSSLPKSDSAAISGTALVIAFLEVKMSAFREEWELIVQKARKWLQKHLQSKQVTPDSLLASSLLFFQMK